MDAYRTINDTLVNLFNEIWELEKEAIITEEFKDITNNDFPRDFRIRREGDHHR